MIVITPQAETIELGTVETAPTIGIIDYSRNETDAFGVTTVVKRGFARRMSLRLAVPFDNVDNIQRRLAELRATPATWIADERFQAMTLKGFYKDFSTDFATSTIAYCSLTIESLIVRCREASDRADHPQPPIGAGIGRAKRGYRRPKNGGNAWSRRRGSPPRTYEREGELM